ncbi:hypothetical protein [Hornefia butyriciproducens]|uniref:hypothetical protein n=1 Tax=Hornefia butyriciproducens TaxID=2652293 RepID=UPI003F8B5D7D
MNEMNAKYYEVIYDKRLGGDNIILYGENMDLINSFPYKTVNGEIVSRETELPLITSDMVQIAKNGSAAAVMHHGKVFELNPNYTVIGDYLDLTDDQLDNMCKGLKGR